MGDDASMMAVASELLATLADHCTNDWSVCFSSHFTRHNNCCCCPLLNFYVVVHFKVFPLPVLTHSSDPQSLAELPAALCVYVWCCVLCE